MRLTSIQDESLEQSHGSGADQIPHNWLEADAPFAAGMKAMKARHNVWAFSLFNWLCWYAGEASPELMPAVRRIRDFLDPARSSEQKGEMLFGFFSPTLVPSTTPGATRPNRSRQRSARGTDLKYWPGVKALAITLAGGPTLARDMSSRACKAFLAPESSRSPA